MGACLKLLSVLVLVSVPPPAFTSGLVLVIISVVLHVNVNECNMSAVYLVNVKRSSQTTMSVLGIGQSDLLVTVIDSYMLQCAAVHI